MTNPLILGLIGAILLIATTALNMLWTTVRQYRTNSRVHQTLTAKAARENALAGVFGQLQALGERVRHFYAPSSLEHLRDTIQVAGFNPHRMLPMLLGGKLVIMLLIIAVAGLTGYMLFGDIRSRLMVLGVGIVLGMLGPEWILAIIRRRFVRTIEQGTPDALDLLVVCSEAGMGLESALVRVSQEMRHSNPAIASVLAKLLDDLRVLPNRRDAFNNLGRTGVEGLRRLGAMLGQSMQYGTPLGNVLRAVAEELRRDRMNKLEERAVKLPAKLIFPMILFIMPSLYIVLLGPSFMRIGDTLSGLTSHHIVVPHAPAVHSPPHR